MKNFVIAMFGLLGVTVAANLVAGSDTSKKPNFIILFIDDLGYGDLGCFGSGKIQTPNIDRMAAEGMRFTNFYAQTVCGPSRAALMTGCYPLRVAKKRNNQTEIHPMLHEQEITIAEILKQQGYATACFGKWDLAGHRQRGYEQDLLPTRQGFDYFFGTPTSNDSIVNLVRNEEVIEEKADMANLTQRYTDEALNFIRKHHAEPFFVYVPHTMPHIRLAASDAFNGQSPRGLYGDVVEEIDFQTGRIIEVIKELGIVENTYIVFTSDNGPWYLDRHPKLSLQKDSGGSHGGDAAPLRGHKTSAWEGGVRVPCVMWAPGRIPAGTVCSEMATTMDMLPTFAALAGGVVPRDRVIDGHDIVDLMHGEPTTNSPTDRFYYYVHTQLMAVRFGNWKLHLPQKVHTMKRWDVFQKESELIEVSSPMLFDLKKDIGEQVNLADQYPEKVEELTRIADKARQDIGDYDRVGGNARFYDPEPRRSDIAQWVK